MISPILQRFVVVIKGSTTVVEQTVNSLWAWFCEKLGVSAVFWQKHHKTQSCDYRILQMAINVAMLPSTPSSVM